ncbi:MAG: TlpA family protein disulfide reductase [Phycisphaerales bacterium]|nr:TlpA family protein disulfide reductase [Phycisphaerales bacterium]
MHRALQLALVLPLLLVVVSCSESSPPAAPAVPKAADFTLESPDGEAFTLSQQRGKVIVIDFWATWCHPCTRAMPHVQALHEKFKDRGVIVVGIAVWENGDPAAYMDEQGYTYKLLLGTDDVAVDYRLTGIPAFFVIGVDGEIVHREVGFSSESGIDEILETYLTEHGM